MKIELSEVVKELFINDNNFDKIVQSIKRVRSWQEITGDLAEVLQVIGWYKYYNYHEQPVLSTHSSYADLEQFKEKAQWRQSMMKDYFGETNVGGMPNLESLLFNTNRPLEFFIITTYFRAFSSSKGGGRLRLNEDNVFKTTEEAKSKHNGLKVIRDKVVAHIEWTEIDRHNQKVECYFKDIGKGPELILSNGLNRTLDGLVGKAGINDLEECTNLSYKFCIEAIEKDFMHFKNSILSKEQTLKLLNRFEAG